MSKVDGKLVYVIWSYGTLSDDQKRRIEEAGPGATYVYTNREEVKIEDLHKANVVLGNPGCEKIAGSPNLEFFRSQSAGVENYCKPGILSPSVKFKNASGTFGPGISEYMLSAVLCLSRKWNIYRDYQKQHRWESAGKALEIYRSTVLVLGTGDIGMQFARKCKALGAYVIGVRRTLRKDKPDFIDEMYTHDDLKNVVGRADVIGMCMPDTPETRGTMNKEIFDNCKKGVIIVNAGRGGAIVTDDLIEALDKGIVGGAGLDVTDPEPLPADHKLWDYENVIITPHNTGGSDWFDHGVDIMIEDWRKYVNDEHLDYVDLSTGYKSTEAKG